MLNIFLIDFFDRSRSGLSISDISDHLPIFSIHSINDVSLNYNQENSVRFLATLEETNWSSLEGYDDPNNTYNSFLMKYSETYNQACFPLKKLAGKRKRINKPWLSKALIKCIKRKNKLYKLYIQNPSTDREIIYKHYKNKLNHSLRIAKRLYYERKLDKVKSKTRDTWRLPNEILNRKKKKVKTSPIFKADDREFSDPVEIANKFCTYFTNIGPSLAKNIQSLHSHRSFLTGSFTQSIYLNPTTKEEIIEIAKTFISGKAAGYDQIPMSIIKQSIHLISEPLTHIINLSIYHGIVPDEMKIACVIPVFKSDDQSLFTNYRPVSVKFLERIIYNRLVHYLQSFNILCEVSIFSVTTNTVSGKIIPPHSPSLTFVIKYLLPLTRANLLSVFSLTFQKPLTRLIMPSFLTNSNIMEYVV